MIDFLRKHLQRFLFKNVTIDEFDDCSVSRDSRLSMPDPLKFRVQPAQGGTIVEVETYDSKKDEYNTKMHVIPEGEDVSEHVGKIVTLEMLRR